jgi:uncharacterized protein YxeA
MDSKESNNSTQQNNKKKIIIAIIALAIIVIIVGLVLYFNSNEKTEEYVKQEIPEQEEIDFTAAHPTPQAEQPSKAVKEPKKEKTIAKEEAIVDIKEIESPKNYLIIKNKEIKGSTISWIVKNDSKSTIYEVHRFKLELQNQAGEVLNESEIEEKFVIHPQEELNFSRKKPKWGNIDYWGVSFINDNIRIIKE